tara:strand:+ start:1071 stop:2111 length:1041 start_codon:yes stop_codon:yes gene_type:complete
VNLSNFQVSLTTAAVATILLSVLFNSITLHRTKNFVPKVRNNEERLSSKYVPPFGGIACSVAFLISTRLLGQAESNFLYIGFFGVIISIIGLLDDLYNFKWYIKLIFQMIIVYIPLYNLNIFINFETLIGIEFNNSVNYIVSTIWIMLIMNAINFIDNMDGLAVVVSSAICIQIAVLTNYLNQYKLTDISILLLCAIGGFLFFNFPPAKLYFGDSGSLFIGFCLGFMSILYNWAPEDITVYTSTLSPILLIFSVPLIDFLVVVTYRVSIGKSPTTGGTDHISHRLLAKGFSEMKVLTIFLSYSFATFIFIYVSIFTSTQISYLLIGSLFILYFLTYLISMRLKVLI